jgi:hypothetical protein
MAGERNPPTEPSEKSHPQAILVAARALIDWFGQISKLAVDDSKDNSDTGCEGKKRDED